MRDQQHRLQESIANALQITVDHDRVAEWWYATSFGSRRLNHSYVDPLPVSAKLSAEAERRARTKLAYRPPSPSMVVPDNPMQSESMHSIQSAVENIIARLVRSTNFHTITIIS